MNESHSNELLQHLHSTSCAVQSALTAPEDGVTVFPLVYATSLVSNNRLTSEDPLRFDLTSAWGVCALQILSLADVAADP